MRKVEIKKIIDAAPKGVWDYISDIKSAPDWVVVMKSLISTTDNPVKLSTFYTERSKIGPNKSETTWKVTRFEEQQIQVHECNGNEFKAKLTMQTKPSGKGTELIHTTQYALLPVFRPLGWLIEALAIHNIMVKSLNESVENCKRNIENTN